MIRMSFIRLPKTAKLTLFVLVVHSLDASGAAAQVSPAQLRPADAYARLDSLEQAALANSSFASRLSAVSTITRISIGQGVCSGGGPFAPTKYPGLVSRLVSIYQRSTDEALRHVILDRMLWQAECTEAVAFLEQVALTVGSAEERGSQSRREGPTLQSHSVDVLAALGASGEQALRRLHSQNAVRDSLALSRLRLLSRTGFRKP